MIDLVKVQPDEVAYKEKQMNNDDRVLVMEVKEGENVKATTGLVDNRLWKGGNKLHAVREPQTSFWYLKYEKGGLPETLKQKFTSFTALRRHAERYFEQRGLELVKVED